MDSRSEIYKVDLKEDDPNDVRTFAHGYIQENAIVLDVGCACGDLGKLLKSSKNCQVHGFEYNHESIAIAKRTEAYSDINQVDLNEFDPCKFSAYAGAFDYIVVLDVLEHLSDPENALRKIIGYLKPGGEIIISLPNVAFGDVKAGLLLNEFNYTETGILDRTHIRFFTHSSMADLLSSLSLKINDVRLKVSDHGDSIGRLPSAVKRYISKSPHSYVYQYVVKVCLAADIDHAEIVEQNRLSVQVKWNSIRAQLRMIKREKWIAKHFPAGGFRHRLVKTVKQRWQGNKA